MDRKAPQQLSKTQTFVLKLVQLYWVHLNFLQRLQNPNSKRAKKTFTFWVQFLVQNSVCHHPTYIWKRHCLWGWVFLNNIIPFTPWGINCNNFSESVITTLSIKIYSIAIISCLKWNLHGFLQRRIYLTQTLRLIFWDPLGSPWNQRYCVLNDLFSQLTK